MGPNPNTINLTENRGTGFNGLSSVKRQEEDKLRRTLTAQMSQIQDLQSALDVKNSLVADLNDQLALLRNELEMLKGDQGRLTTERKQTEAQLAQKDDIIRKLEERLREAKQGLQSAESQLENVRFASRQQEEGYRMEIETLRRRLDTQKDTEVSEILRQKETEVRSFREEILRKDERIRQLETQAAINEKNHKQKREKETKSKEEMYKQVKLAPKVERINKPAYEIQYEQDPFILEQNQKLAEELKQALNNERRAYSELEIKIQEISNLNVTLGLNTRK